MQNLTHQHHQPPRPPCCGTTLREHLSSLPALHHAATTYPMLQRWLLGMVTAAAERNPSMLKWHASRVEGYLLGVSSCTTNSMSGAMTELSQLCCRLKVGAVQ